MLGDFQHGEYHGKKKLALATLGVKYKLNPSIHLFLMHHNTLAKPAFMEVDMSDRKPDYVRAASVSEVAKRGCMTVHLGGQIIALFTDGDSFYAIDNRCPHMGFPLDRGTIEDGILTCHWHHARFDLESGGTFDQWADDVPHFSVEIQDGDILVDISQHEDPFEHQHRRLLVGLQRNIPLVTGKAVLKLFEEDPDLLEPFCEGLEFGTGFRSEGWGQGLTILTCMKNLFPFLDDKDKPRALYHGLSAVSHDTIGSAPRFGVWPLPNDGTPVLTLRRWFRKFIEVRDAEGAERCLVSAVAAGADDMQMADMLFSAATDHRYIQSGHILDFTNKAFEALDKAGWEDAGTVLTSLVRSYAMAERMEETSAWRYPLDLVALLDKTFKKLPDALEAGQIRKTSEESSWIGREELVEVILGDSPQATVEAMLKSLTEGASILDLASVVSYAAALRIARFHSSNEFSDWDTALHTFTFANAVEQGLRRAPSPELLRGVFDAAMSVYLDRFLNIPSAHLPRADEVGSNKKEILLTLPTLLDSQQRVDEAGEAIAAYLYNGGELKPLMATIGSLLLREDRDFHTIQAVEAVFRQVQSLSDKKEITHIMIAAIRYLAAHSPTVRAQEQTYQIAQRLHKGEELFN
jgi:nitrite reductase/ring-hydroxylating ferredoxin subunit